MATCPSCALENEERAVACANCGETLRKLSWWTKVLSVFSGGSARQAKQHFIAGIKLLEEERYEGAMVEFDEAIRLDPDDAAVYGSRGDAYSRMGEYGRAVPDYGEAIRLQPEDFVAYGNRGIASNELREYDRAIQDLSEAIRLKPDIWVWYGWRGRSYTSKGEYERALQDVAEVIRLDPDEHSAYFERARLHSLRHEIEECLADLQTTVRLGSKSKQPEHVELLKKMVKEEEEWTWARQDSRIRTLMGLE